MRCFLQANPAVLDSLTRNQFEAVKLGDSVLPAVRLEIPDHDVHTWVAQLLCVFEHLICLAHACGVAEIHFEATAGFWGSRGLLVRENPDIERISGMDQPVHRGAHEPVAPA